MKTVFESLAVIVGCGWLDWHRPAVWEGLRLEGRRARFEWKTCERCGKFLR